MQGCEGARKESRAKGMSTARRWGSRQLKLTPLPRFLPNASLAARPSLLPHQVKCYSQVTEPVQLQDSERLAQLVGPGRVAQLQQCIRHLSSR